MSSRCIHGRSASGGYASGTVGLLQRVALSRTASADPTVEAAALRAAIERATSELCELVATVGGEAAEILEFQTALLADPALSDPAFAAIDRGINAHLSWAETLETEIAGYRASADEYFRARASDLEDLRDRVLNLLAGRGAMPVPEGNIILAEDMTPSQFLATDWTGRGIVLRHGSTTSHIAMLARARGVPMIVGAQIDTMNITSAHALLDGTQGTLTLAPGPQESAEFHAQSLSSRQRREADSREAGKPARTADGLVISVSLNISDPSELDLVDPTTCDGIGLVRTELLFHGWRLPDEAEQLEVYRRIVAWAGGRNVTIRTLDAGGDKPISGLTIDGETNPFLGVRGVRLSLRHPDILTVQLRALARAAAEGPLDVMIPMISVPAEVEAVRALLDQACTDLSRSGIAHRRPALGIMVEVPSVAILPERFDVDFFSIGSNDLVQYTLATGRDVETASEPANVLDPAVLRLIGNVVSYAERSGRRVTICGDAAGDPRYIPALLDVGLRRLSVAPSQLGAVKSVIRSCIPSQKRPAFWHRWLWRRQAANKVGME